MICFCIFNYDVTDPAFQMNCNIFDINILCYSLHSSCPRAHLHQEINDWFIAVYARTTLQHQLTLSISLRDWGCIIQLLLSLQQGCCFQQPFPLQIWQFKTKQLWVCFLEKRNYGCKWTTKKLFSIALKKE